MKMIFEYDIVERYNQNKRVPVFIDLSNIAYRSAFVFTPDKFKTSQGIPNGHLFGICQIIKTLLTLEYEVYLCRDLPSTFRKELNENYKANRDDESRLDIHNSLNVTIASLISKLDNVHILSSEGYEADDIMFSASKLCSENSIKCWILSTDKDMCQALDDNISIAHKFTQKGPQEIVTVDSEYYKKNFEDIEPRCLPFYRAFKGDASDNLEAPVKRFPKDLLKELCDEYRYNIFSDNIASLLVNHKCSKKSHEKWIEQLTKDKDTFVKLFNNYRMMKLSKIDFHIEDEALVDNAFEKVTSDYELWSFKKFVKEYSQNHQNDLEVILEDETYNYISLIFENQDCPFDDESLNNKEILNNAYGKSTEYTYKTKSRYKSGQILLINSKNKLKPYERVLITNANLKEEQIKFPLDKIKSIDDLLYVESI